MKKIRKKFTPPAQPQTKPEAISRVGFLSRILGGSVAIAACTVCGLSAVVPGTRPGAKPQGNGCCKHKHCRYFTA